MIMEFKHITSVKGELHLPGDKSISHRAVIFASLAKGKSRIINLSDGDDVNSTKSVFENLGIIISELHNEILIEGKGFNGLSGCDGQLNAGNSGTTARLLAGILAMQNFTSSIIGDKSLSKRPMKRVLEPLSLMGADIKSSEHSTLPLFIFPSQNLKPITFEMTVPSAQVKSTVLLAGLHLEEPTCVIENSQTRDHTEVMLNLKSEVINGKKHIYSSMSNYPVAQDYFIPSDISTASFFIVLALISQNSALLIKNCSLNPTRTGVIDILKKMGGKIEILNTQNSGGEVYGDIYIESSKLKNINIEEEIIPNIIDEIPILSVAGVFADGDFIIKGAKELRVKESDRITALVNNYRILGLKTEESEDGFLLSGDVMNGECEFESYGDHRIAMSFAVLSMLLKHGGKINNYECVSISNPKYLDQLYQIVKS